MDGSNWCINLQTRSNKLEVIKAGTTENCLRWEHQRRPPPMLVHMECPYACPQLRHNLTRCTWPSQAALPHMRRIKVISRQIDYTYSYRSDLSRWRNSLLHVDIPIQVPPVSDHASQEITICTWRDAIDAVVRTHEAACPAILDAAPEGRVVSIFQISDCDLHRRAGDGKHWRYKLLEGLYLAVDLPLVTGFKWKWKYQDLWMTGWSSDIPVHQSGTCPCPANSPSHKQRNACSRRTPWAFSALAAGQADPSSCRRLLLACPSRNESHTNRWGVGPPLTSLALSPTAGHALCWCWESSRSGSPGANYRMRALPWTPPEASPLFSTAHHKIRMTPPRSNTSQNRGWALRIPPDAEFNVHLGFYADKWSTLHLQHQKYTKSSSNMFLVHSPPCIGTRGQKWTLPRWSGLHQNVHRDWRTSVIVVLRWICETINRYLAESLYSVFSHKTIDATAISNSSLLRFSWSPDHLRFPLELSNCERFSI